MHHPDHPRRPWPLLALIISLNLLLAGAALSGLAQHPQASAQSRPLSAGEQAILAEVRRRTSPPADLAVERRPDGSRFINAQGQLQAVLLARLDANGNPIARCVTSLEEAAAFLQGTDPAAAMVIAADPIAAARSSAESARATQAILADAQTTITIVNLDDPGEGFNDPTPATPSGGNPGATIGEQRLRAFEYAAAIWAAAIQSSVPIRIAAQFDQLPCDATSAVLGSAGPGGYDANFTGTGLAPGPEYRDTVYPIALANKHAGRDLDPSGADINATFNRALGTPGCLTGRSWYYGLDGSESGQIDLVSTLLHEFGHGLGFLSLVNLGTGTNRYGLDDLWNQFLFDNTQGRLWKQLSSAERSSSMVNTGNLIWSGPLVTAAAAGQLQNTPQLTVTAPLAIAGAYTVGLAEFGAPLTGSPLQGELALASDPADAAGGATTDACSTLTNPAEVSGKLALADRGSCTFVTKARNAQEAGAIALLVLNDRSSLAPPFLTGSDPSITIPVVSLSQADGNTIRSQLSSSIVGQLGRDRTRLAGADPAGQVQMYAPSQIQGGSSVSHFDVAASPNLLMEPVINADLDQSLDLTDELLRDIGWYPDRNYNDRDDRLENIHVSQTLAPGGVLRAGAAITLTVTISNFGATADQVQLTDQFNPGLTAISWVAAYSGGAGGPAGGSGDLDASLSLPAGTQATIQVSATIATAVTATFTNTATIELTDPTLDFLPEDNTATIPIPIEVLRLHLPLLPH